MYCEFLHTKSNIKTPNWYMMLMYAILRIVFSLIIIGVKCIQMPVKRSLLVAQNLYGKAVQVNVFADAAQADDFITHRSTTNIILFVNGTPIQWYSKRQNTVESSTYGSEFVAMRIATELTIGLRNDLYTLGFPIYGPANLFCDNQSVVINSSIPSSVLKKKHNSTFYHRMQESVAAGILRIAKEPTETNLADKLTKPLAGPKFKKLISHILF